ncbi:hypothetical protein [Zooshikella ganghwensis]|uniref:hypothetical protein n=1 Tax=Zooshikella ganghwensis TaxID=202772 RepID=UPI0003FE4986|nr:hypothetical protein [Zooshikella ganghwensis]
MRFKQIDVRPFSERMKEDPSYDITQDRYWEADETMSIYGDPELGTSVWDDVRSLEQIDEGRALLPYVIREKTPPIMERLVPPVPEPDTSPDVNYKIVVEVAGIQHNSSQRLYLSADKDSEQGLDLKAAVTHFKDGERYRSLVEFNNLQNVPRELGIRIAMHGKGEMPLYLPLINQIQPVPKETEKAPWETIIIPVKPLGYITEKKVRPESDILQEGGWVYVFWKNKLWRELEVTKNQTYRDTHVTFYRNARQSRLGLTDPNARKALGTAYDTIWIPYKLNGEVQQGNNGIKMLFSRRQLSWSQIDKLEGNTAELNKQATTVDAMAIYDSERGFDIDDGPLGPIAPALLDQDADVALPPQNPRVSSAQYLDRNRQHKIPVVYLDNVPYVYLKLQLLDDDGELLVNTPYTIKLEPSFLLNQHSIEYIRNAPALKQWTSSGSSDAEGIVEVQVPAIAEFAVINYTPEGESEPQSSLVNVGVLAPEDSVEGQKGALNNVSIHSGLIDQPADECYQAAVGDFKAATGASDQEWLQNITHKKQYC